MCRSDYLEKGAIMKRVASVGEAMIELSMSDENARVGVAGDGSKV